VQEKRDGEEAEIIRLATGDQAGDAEDADIAQLDDDWDALVKRARARAKKGFDADEISAKDAVAIILADARIRERTKKPDDDPLNDLRDQVASALGIKRDHKTVSAGERAERQRRTGRR
jgi:hypothetical protein